jgi:hypothetical protein
MDLPLSRLLSPATAAPGQGQTPRLLHRDRGHEHVAWDGTCKSDSISFRTKQAVVERRGGMLWGLWRCRRPRGHVSWLHHCMPDFPRIFLFTLCAVVGCLGDD